MNRSERWSGSEDKVRAEFYAELIYKYGYLRGVAQIRFKKFADLEVKLPEHIRTYYELGE